MAFERDALLVAYDLENDVVFFLDEAHEIVQLVRTECQLLHVVVEADERLEAALRHLVVEVGIHFEYLFDFVHFSQLLQFGGGRFLKLEELSLLPFERRWCNLIAILLLLLHHLLGRDLVRGHVRCFQVLNLLRVRVVALVRHCFVVACCADLLLILEVQRVTAAR